MEFVKAESDFSEHVFSAIRRRSNVRLEDGQNGRLVVLDIYRFHIDHPKEFECTPMNCFERVEPMPWDNTDERFNNWQRKVQSVMLGAGWKSRKSVR